MFEHKKSGIENWKRDSEKDGEKEYFTFIKVLYTKTLNGKTC